MFSKRYGLVIKMEQKIEERTILLKCPKCDWIQEENKSFYDEYNTICSHSSLPFVTKPHPYTCPNHTSHIELIKVESYDELKTRFEEDVEKLQKLCPHPKTEVTDWIDEWWAPGHSTGQEVKICQLCKDEINRRVHCQICHTPITDYKWIKGDGTNDHPGGTKYCEKCWGLKPAGWYVYCKKCQCQLVLISGNESKCHCPNSDCPNNKEIMEIPRDDDEEIKSSP